MKKISTLFIASSFLPFSCKNPPSLNARDLIEQSSFAQDKFSTDCEDAQNAYKIRNFDVLSDKGISCYLSEKDNPETVKNMNELFVAAYRANNGFIPSRQKVGSNLVKNLGIEIRNANRPNPKSAGWKIGFSFDSETDVTLEALKIETLDGNVVMDLASVTDSGKGSGDYWFTQETSTPPQDGLYKLTYQITSEQSQTIYVPLVDQLQLASPAIVSPSDGSTIYTEKPTMSWNACPAKDDSIQRESASVAFYESIGEKEPWIKKWGVSGLSREVTQVQLGVTAGGTGVAKLNPGNYRAWINCKQFRKFGPLKLTRASRDFTRFQVAAPKQ